MTTSLESAGHDQEAASMRSPDRSTRPWKRTERKLVLLDVPDAAVEPRIPPGHEPEEPVQRQGGQRRLHQPESRSRMSRVMSGARSGRPAPWTPWPRCRWPPCPRRVPRVSCAVTVTTDTSPAQTSTRPACSTIRTEACRPPGSGGRGSAPPRRRRAPGTVNGPRRPYRKPSVSPRTTTAALSGGARPPACPTAGVGDGGRRHLGARASSGYAEAARQDAAMTGNARAGGHGDKASSRPIQTHGNSVFGFR